MKNEEQLLADLHGGPPGEAPDNALHARIKREHERSQKKILIACFLYLLIGIAFMLYGGVMLKYAGETRTMFYGAIVVIIGFEITVLVKLGYGNAWSLVRTLLAVKELQLALCERDTSEPPRASEEDAK
ncbi:MAG: hypothetical protein JXR94_17545 [Candidatus Hydrogenedentes bacterium]|nr:hypothetical protein [Candidatus Hydrogenedentota bacterium]